MPVELYEVTGESDSWVLASRGESIKTSLDRGWDDLLQPHAGRDARICLPLQEMTCSLPKSLCQHLITTAVRRPEE